MQSNSATIERLEDRLLCSSTAGAPGRVVENLRDVDEATDVVRDARGRILVLGQTDASRRDSEPPHFFLARYLADGSCDPGFGRNGKVITDFDDFLAAQALALAPDGKIVVVGRATRRTSPPVAYPQADPNRGFGDYAVARFNPDGSPDRTFGKDGKVVADLGADRPETAIHVDVTPDGRVVVLVWEIGTPGQTLTAQPGLPVVFPKVPPPPAVPSRMAVIRLGPDGRPDAGFGNGGTAIVPVEDATAGLKTAMALLPDGKVLVASGVADMLRLSRLNADGSPDAAFGAGGSLGLAIAAGSTVGVASMAVMSDGSAVIAGTATAPVVPRPSPSSDPILRNEPPPDSDVVLVRLDARGTPDGNFGGGDGIAIAVDPTRHDEAVDVALADDGSLFVAGTHIAYAGDINLDYSLVERFNAGGDLDASFGTGGRVQFTMSGDRVTYGDRVAGLVVQPEDRLTVVGTANDDLALARFNADGTPDPSFAGAPIARRGRNPSPLPAPGTGPARQVLPGGGRVTLRHGVLRITGSDADDTLSLDRYQSDATTAWLRLRINGEERGSIRLSTLHRVVFYGRGGNDFAFVDPAASVPALIHGGPGNDELIGGLVNDRLRGGGGNDQLYGQSGNDRIVGGPGDDFLVGGFGLDALSGGRGRDFFVTRGEETPDAFGRDTIDGGPGRDAADADAADVLRHLESGKPINPARMGRRAR